MKPPNPALSPADELAERLTRMRQLQDEVDAKIRAVDVDLCELERLTRDADAPARAVDDNDTLNTVSAERTPQFPHLQHPPCPDCHSRLTVEVECRNEFVGGFVCPDCGSRWHQGPVANGRVDRIPGADAKPFIR